MEFEWDPEKAAANLRKHGLDFRDAWEVFEGQLAVEDDWDGREEDRKRAVGWLRWIPVTVVYTEPNPNTVRLISLRKATLDEQRRFWANLQRPPRTRGTPRGRDRPE